MVARPGNTPDGLSVVTAIGFTLPDLMWGCAASAVANTKSVSPVMTEVIAGPPPLKEMMGSLSPAYWFNISIDRWLVVPAPLLAGVSWVLLASATRSFTDFTGTLGCVTSTSGTEEIQLIGVKCLNAWKFTGKPQ